MLPIQSKTRLQIRQAVGYLLGSLIVGEVAATAASTATLPCPLELQMGGSNDYKGRQVIITAATGTHNIGSIRYVSAFNSTSGKKLTLAPSLTATLEAGDDFELWEDYRIKNVNEAINQAIRSATDDILVNKQTSTAIKLENQYEYNCLSSFVGLHTVEYVYDIGVDHLLDDCEDTWVAGSANVTASLDETIQKVGDGCAKFVEDGNSGTDAILGTEVVSSVDLYNYDTIEFWMYSSIALTAGELQFHLSSTALIASAEETIDIPAMTAATWYKHSLSLANPHSDTDIISIGVYQVTDVGAFTFYVDDVHAILANSRIWHILNPDMWFISQASTPLLGLTQAGYNCITNGTPLRLTGYAIPAELTADATACEIDPDYVIAYAAATLMSNNLKPTGDDIDASRRLIRNWFDIAEMKKLTARTPLEMNTRWCV